MIRDLKPYPAYKESGLPWLGAIPEGWEVRRNGRLFSQRNETGREELPILEVSLRTGVRVRTFATSDRKQVMADPKKYKRAAKGDLAYNMMRMWQGALGVSPDDGLVSPAYVVARPFDDVESGYYAYLFRTDAYLSEVDKFSRGIVKDRNRLYWEDFKRIPSPYPPKEGQAAIVRFLDHADRRIRGAIRAKRKLIALLNEQMLVIIHQAVTRGLDPNVRLKPSGVEWLGDVPEHWEVARLGRLIQLTTGFPFKSDGFTQSETDIRLLRGTNIAPGQIRWDDVVRWPEVDCKSYANFEMEFGDIVLGMDRPIISSGVRVATLRENDIPSLLLQRVARIRPTKELGSDFLLLLLSGHAFLRYLAPIFTGISVPHISPEQIGAFRFALPSRNEQDTIVGWVETATAQINTAIECAQKELTSLVELRTRLISNVVTGRLDVRDAASRLHVEEEMAESVNDREAILEDEEIPEDAESEEVEA